MSDFAVMTEALATTWPVLRGRHVNTNIKRAALTGQPVYTIDRRMLGNSRDLTACSGQHTTSLYWLNNYEYYRGTQEFA